MSFKFGFYTIILAIATTSCSSEKLTEGKVPFPEELSAKTSRGLVCLIKEGDSHFISWRKLIDDKNDQTYFLWRKSGDKNENIAQTKMCHFVVEKENGERNIS